MRRALLLAALWSAAGAPPLPVPLQAQGAPEFIVTFGAGFSPEHTLWRLARQPVAVPETPGALLVDTFALTRTLRPGPGAWVALTRYARPWLGVGAEAAWVAVRSGTSCAFVGTPQPDPYGLNAAACNGVSGSAPSTGALTLLAVGTVRTASALAVRPFATAGLGIALLSGSFVEVATDAPTAGGATALRVFSRADRRALTWAGLLAGGVVLGGTQNQRLRVEVRDVILGLPVVTGAAPMLDDLPAAPSRLGVTHRLAFAVALDWMLSGRRTRRY